MLIGVLMQELEKQVEQLQKASFKPTQAMINNAKRGLALREKWNRGGLSGQQAKSAGVGSGVARARDIINGSLSLDTVKRMNSFFARHADNYQPSERMPDGGPTAGTIAWLLWGGSAGKAWARSIANKEETNKSVSSKLPVTKSQNEELMQVTYVAMLPDSTDLHGDFTSADEVRKAMESFNRSNAQANLFHLAMTDKFSVIESYLAPVDFELDDNFVEKGTWLMTLQVKDPDVWSLVKSGEINGISIGALASVEKLEEEN